MNRKIHIILAVLIVIPLLCAANPIKGKWSYEKSKTIKRDFSVNTDALLRIKNKYGNVDVISWDQNKVEIEVVITVRGNSESKVVSRLEKIDVNFENSKSEVSARTVIENSSKSWFHSNDKMNYEINYKIKMPVTNHANLTNDYGTISLNEIKGKATINCDYGKILIGSLYNVDNNINIDYTSGSEIDLMNGGNINADYSKLRVVKAKNIRLNADYTNTVFENIENLNFVCDYGKVEVENGNVIDGNGDYLTMRFGTIYKKLKIEADYGGIKVGKLMKGFESLYIHSDYTGIKIGMEKDAAFNFIAKLSYGGFAIDNEAVTYLKKIVKSSSKYYEGYVNSDNSGSVMNISSEYGSVNIYNN